MGASRPVLGYPSRSAACRALRMAGLSNSMIVARFAATGETITARQVSALLSYTVNSGGTRLNVGRAVIERLGPEAVARGITVTELAEWMLDVIAHDGMVGAVLDDCSLETNDEETGHG